MGGAMFSPCYLKLSHSVMLTLQLMDCSPPGSSIHGILQARVLEWAAISFSRRSSQPRDQDRTHVSLIAGRCFNLWATQYTVEVMKIMASFKKSHACSATLTVPNPAAGQHQPTPPLETPGHSQASLSQSFVGSLLLSPGSWCIQGSICIFQESISQSYVSSGSSVVGLMVTSSKRAYAIPRSAAPRAPVPAAVHCRPVPPQEMLKHSPISVSVGSLSPWCAQGLFEPSDHLWWEWGLILNMNPPLLPSCWGFSFVLGRGVSPHSSSNATQPDPGGRNRLLPPEVLRLDLEVPLMCCSLVLKKYQIDKDTLFGYCLWLEAVFSNMWNLNWPMLLRLKTSTVS